MDLILVRHPEVELDISVCYGVSDVKLSYNGKKLIPKIINKLKSFDGNYIVYSSPLERCISVAASYTKQFIVEESLKEINFGDWELTTWEMVPRDELDKWASNIEAYRFPNGESVLEFKKRVLAFLNKIIHNKKDSIFITHSGVIKTILEEIYNKRKSFFDFKIGFGDIIRIRNVGQNKNILEHYSL